MRSIAVRTSRWAGPAAIVLAAVALELATNERGTRRGGARPVGRHVSEPVTAEGPGASTSGRRIFGFITAMGRWAGRVGVLAAVVVFALLVIGPQTGRYRTLTVLTASMRPAFPPGSVAVVVPIPVDEVAVGDVITYRIPVDDHRVVTHRVVEVVRPGVVRTRGDANNSDDPWVAKLKGQNTWKAQARVPGLGYAINAMRTPTARLLAVTIATLISVVVGLRTIWRRPVLA